MDARAYRIAREFVRAQVRRARYAPEFLRVVDPQKFRNPETGNEVRFVSLPDDEQKRIYDAWRSKNNVEEPKAPKATTPEEITARNIDIVRNGQETGRAVLSSGGRGGSGPVNESYIVQLEYNGETQEFIYKPASGEEPFLRVGIPAGQYHAREQAAYSIDAMLGGQGVVPVTHTRGKDEGSYQLWAEGARGMRGKDLNDLVEKVSVDELPSSPDFQRLNVMDLLIGHEDRHRGNLLYYFDGDETPENLRFVAIDNGLSMASPSQLPDHRVYVHPFQQMLPEDENEESADPFATPRKEDDDAAKAAKEAGDKAVAQALSRITPELHDRIKKLDLKEVAKSMTQAGVDEEGAVRAALVRIAAVQADPTIFKEMLRRQGGDLDKAWRDFQHLSGWKDDLLWRSGAGEDAEKRIDAAMRQARPRGGWTQAVSLEEAQKAMNDLENWGDAAPDDATAPAPKVDEADFSMLANVRDRWMMSFVKTARGRKLTISEVSPRTRKPRVVGVFELGRDGNVKEQYKDHRFRRDIQQGIRLMGKRFVPKDGAKFMGALEKVYGSRSLYDVKRT
jgi:hypothetical protein